MSPPAGLMTFAWVMFFTMATYINAGWMREQVCLHMCPYARFQSAMFDKNKLAVGYSIRDSRNHVIVLRQILKQRLTTPIENRSFRDSYIFFFSKIDQHISQKLKVTGL